MLQSEFTQRTKINVTADMFDQIHKDYMKSKLDKDAFCAQWKRKHAEEATESLVSQIQTLKNQLAEEQQKRESERVHADKELIDVCNVRDAYMQELIRIFDIEGDEKAIWSLRQRVISNYYKR